MNDQDKYPGEDLTQNSHFGSWWLAFLLGGAVLVLERTVVARIYEFGIRGLAWVWVLSGRFIEFFIHVFHHLIGR